VNPPRAYDVAIVGAGCAGCLLAARLSEDRTRRVLLLEAGPDYSTAESLPADIADGGTLTTSHDWGTVALAKARARWIYLSGQISDHEGQFGERVGETTRWSDIGPEVVEAPAEVLDEGVPVENHPRDSVTLQPSHRSKAGVETPVVGLERIVRVGLRVVEGGQEQLIEDARVDPVPVGGDVGR
jgi:hypothetical protein